MLHQKIIALEKELDAKQSLELEIERLRGHIEVMKHIKEDEDDAGKKMKGLTESLEEKEQQLEHLDMLSQMLIVKERKVNEELQDARKELISVGFPCGVVSLFAKTTKTFNYSISTLLINFANHL